MSKIRTSLVALSASLATALVVGSAFQTADGAEPDTTSPNLEAQADFLIGGQISTSNLLDVGSGTCDDGSDNDYTGVPYRISWEANDASGVSNYTTWRTYDGMYPEFREWWGDSSEWPEQSFTDGLSDYDGDCGGGSLVQSGWAVTAYDEFDNAKWVQVGGRNPVVVQENGATPSGNGGSPTYSGQWTNANCACASGGRQRWTNKAGASVTLTVSGPQEIAIVMAKGPGRGQADIYLDGSRAATVDTHASANTNRIIVWSRDLTAGSHTIQIKNLATAGHPRIDFDALVVG